MSLDITEIRMKKLDDSKTAALVSITISGCFVVTGLRLVNGAKGMFLGFPSRKKKDGEFADIAFPINKECRNAITEAVIAEYKKEDDSPF